MLKKKGQLVRSDDGSLVLVNESGKTFNVNQSVVTIWKRCDGKTRVELSREIAGDKKSIFDKVDAAMINIIGHLVKAGLVEDTQQELKEVRSEEIGEMKEQRISTPKSQKPIEVPEPPIPKETKQQDRLKNIIKALRDIQKRLARLENKIDEMKRFELKTGDRLVFKEDDGKLIVEKN